MNSLTYLLIGAVALVALILFAGVGVMMRGGEIDKKYSNKLMWLRVGAQFAAVMILFGLLYFAG